MEGEVVFEVIEEREGKDTIDPDRSCAAETGVEEEGSSSSSISSSSSSSSSSCCRIIVGGGGCFGELF
jgi:hypothetical protein